MDKLTLLDHNMEDIQDTLHSPVTHLSQATDSHSQATDSHHIQATDSHHIQAMGSHRPTAPMFPATLSLSNLDTDSLLLMDSHQLTDNLLLMVSPQLMASLLPMDSLPSRDILSQDTPNPAMANLQVMDSSLSQDIHNPDMASSLPSNNRSGATAMPAM